MTVIKSAVVAFIITAFAATGIGVLNTSLASLDSTVDTANSKREGGGVSLAARNSANAGRGQRSNFSSFVTFVNSWKLYNP